MNTEINIIVETDLTVNHDRVKQAVFKTLQKATFTNDCAVSIIVQKDKDVQKLNKNYRNKDKPTNVLSFPAYDPDTPHLDGTPVELGDIVLAHETIVKEAEQQNKTIENHLTHLIIHGTLHLLGHDHEIDEEADIMEALEIDILNDLGIENPYT